LDKISRNSMIKVTADLWETQLTSWPYHKMHQTSSYQRLCLPRYNS